MKNTAQLAPATPSTKRLDRPTTVIGSANTPPKRRGKTPRRCDPCAPAIEQPSCFYRLDQRTKRAIERAAKLLEQNAIYRCDGFTSPSDMRAYLKFKLASLEHEEFHAVWLDAQNRVIAFDRVSSGSLMQTRVYPREVVKTALWHNAAAVVFAHNHPSGQVLQSQADELLTRELETVLALVDVRVLDHFIVAGNAEPLSFAERGLI